MQACVLAEIALVAWKGRFGWFESEEGGKKGRSTGGVCALRFSLKGLSEIEQICLGFTLAWGVYVMVRVYKVWKGLVLELFRVRDGRPVQCLWVYSEPFL